MSVRPDVTDLQVAQLTIMARRMRRAAAGEVTVEGADLVAMQEVEGATDWRVRFPRFGEARHAD